jgi:hypothetical protein
LRERLVQSQSYNTAEVEDAVLDDEILSHLLGIKELREQL